MRMNFCAAMGVVLSLMAEFGRNQRTSEDLNNISRKSFLKTGNKIQGLILTILAFGFVLTAEAAPNFFFLGNDKITGTWQYYDTASDKLWSQVIESNINQAQAQGICSSHNPFGLKSSITNGQSIAHVPSLSEWDTMNARDTVERSEISIWSRMWTSTRHFPTNATKTYYYVPKKSSPVGFQVSTAFAADAVCVTDLPKYDNNDVADAPVFVRSPISTINTKTNTDIDISALFYDLNDEILTVKTRYKEESNNSWQEVDLSLISRAVLKRTPSGALFSKKVSFPAPGNYEIQFSARSIDGSNTADSSWTPTQHTIHAVKDGAVTPPVFSGGGKDTGFFYSGDLFRFKSSFTEHDFDPYVISPQMRIRIVAGTWGPSIAMGVDHISNNQHVFVKSLILNDPAGDYEVQFRAISTDISRAETAQSAWSVAKPFSIRGITPPRVLSIGASTDGNPIGQNITGECSLQDDDGDNITNAALQYRKNGGAWIDKTMSLKSGGGSIFRATFASGGEGFYEFRCKGMSTTTSGQTAWSNWSNIISRNWITVLPDSRQLTASVVGGGKIVSSPQGINCPTDCSEDILVNKNISLTAVANAGSNFLRWEKGCESRGNQHECTIRMDQDRSVKAVFEKKIAESIVTAISPTSAHIEELKEFCFTGSNLRSRMGFYIDECVGETEVRGNSVERCWQCTPSFTTGIKNGVIKDAPRGKELFNFSINITQNTSLEPVVTAISPLSARAGELTEFCYTGSNLHSDMGFHIDQCAGKTEVRGNSVERCWQCTSSFTTGIKNGVIKDAPRGKELFNFNINVVSNSGGNTAPNITSSALKSIPEGNTFIYSPIAVNDAEGESLNFAITGGADQALFNIGTVSGNLAFILPPDFENPKDEGRNNTYIVNITVTDGAGLTDNQDFVITIKDVAEGGTQVLAAGEAASDSVQHGLYKYYKVIPNAGTTDVTVKLTVLAGDVNLYVKQGGQPIFSSFDCASAYSGITIESCTLHLSTLREVHIGVYGNDFGSSRYTLSASYHGNSGNTAPTIISSTLKSIPENTREVYLPVNIADAEGGDMNFTITGGTDKKLFSINKKTGALIFISAPDFENPKDLSVDNSYNVLVTVTDNTGLSDVQDFFITITDVDETSDLPPMERSKGGTITNKGLIDKNKPTIVLVHGLSEKLQDVSKLWTGFKDTQAGGLIFKDLGNSVNIIQYVWSDAFQAGLAPSMTEYNKANAFTSSAGVNLANQLINILGQEYDNKIHFIGHSLGTVVSTYAISALLEKNKNIKEIQFTALDRPDRIENRIQGAGLDQPSPFINKIPFRNYGKDFFVLNLPFDKNNINISLDNYYVSNVVSFGVGDIATRTSITQNIYNHALISPDDVADLIGLDKEGIENDHSGVHQWYRWTMNPNGFNNKTYCTGSLGVLFDKPKFIDETLNPCKKGWAWSLNKEIRFLPQPNAPIIRKDIGHSHVLASIINKNVNFGCSFFEDDATLSSTNQRILRCFERKSKRASITKADSLTAKQLQSSPYSISTITIPEGTTHISFDYSFDNRGDGDYASVLIDGKEIWKMSGISIIEEGVFQYTGLLPLFIESGDKNLTIALYGVEEKNAEFALKNITLHSIKSDLDGIQDADTDGIKDAEDNCPAVTNPDQANFDQDALGNACDPDDDNDGLPDSWENQYGLDPLNAADANQDSNNNGISNLQEYLAGTNPIIPIEARDLVYIPLDAPCRIVNTGSAASPFNNNRTLQSFIAWGSTNQLNPQRDKNGTLGLTACLPENGLKPLAMAANVTVAAKGTKAKGNVITYPFGSAVPSASMVNFFANNIANSSIITLNPDSSKHFTVRARINGFNSGGSHTANVIIDTLGYFYPQEALAVTDKSALSLSYIVLPEPCRIVNTVGINKPFQAAIRTRQTFLAWGTSLVLNGQRDADGNANLGNCLPESNMKPAAMMANVTVAAKRFKSIGNVVAFKHGDTPPTASLVNFSANNIANASIISLNPDAQSHFDIEAKINNQQLGGSKQAHVIVDTQGYFYSKDELTAAGKSGLSYIPLSEPCRIVDTRGVNQTFNDSNRITQSFKAWGSAAELNLQRNRQGSEGLLGACQPINDRTPAAVMVNVTVAAKRFKSRGNVVAYPAGGVVPKSSLVNFLGSNIANSSIIAVNPDNAQHFNIEAKILNNDPGGSKQADVIVDVIGYFYP